MLRVAQIGIGYWGPNLLRNLVENKRCQVAKVVDISKERCEFIKNLYPTINVSCNVFDIINDPEIDAIIIATPVATHFELACSALENGKHVLVEKPLARSVSEVKSIGKIASKHKKIAMVGHTFLFNAAVRFVKELIDNNSLGEIRYIYSQRLNLGRIRSDVDALWNFAPHDISIIQYWLGDPEPISVARRGVAHIQETIEDVVFLNILYPNNIMANIHVSWLDPNKVRSMTVVGSKKMLVYDDIAENKITIYDKGIDCEPTLKKDIHESSQCFPSFIYRSGEMIKPEINFIEPLKIEIDHFLDCIENKSECITDINHAYKVVKILSANQNKVEKDYHTPIESKYLHVS